MSKYKCPNCGSTNEIYVEQADWDWIRIKCYDCGYVDGFDPMDFIEEVFFDWILTDE